LFFLCAAEFQFEFALLGPQHDRLAFHPADHVEGSARLAAQCQFQEIFFNAGLHGLAQRALDLKEAIRGAESFDALMRTLVIVILDPEFDPLAGRLEAVELGAGEELLPDGLPEALDFTEGHGVMRAGLEMRHPILLQLGFETGSAAPGGVLPAIVSEHLPGRLELADRHAIHLDDRLGGGTAEQIRAHDEA